MPAADLQLVIVTNRFSHAAHALDELLDDADVKLALGRWNVARVDCDERPDVDVFAQRRTDRKVPTWPVIIAGGMVATHLNRASLLALLRSTPNPLTPPPLPPPPTASVDDALAAMRAPEEPPLRPRPAALDLLLAIDPSAALPTLDALVQGGIHDQLGGGFHFYSTDERWVVPHFEKRAVDQAALLATFARAAAATGQHRYAAVARRIIAYVECRLALDGGGYAASEDADVGNYDDGSLYTWTVDEARAVLDADELAVAQPYFDLYGRGELHSDPTRNVLFIAASPEEVARELGRAPADVRALVTRVRDKLLAARSERPQPAVDSTPYAGVSAKMARAYLEAETALGVVQDRERAIFALERLYASRAGDGGITHRLDDHRSLRWLGDHAELGLAALRAFEVTSERVHLVVARALADHMIERFWHASGGFASQPGGDDRPFRDGEDGPGPSANAVAGTLLHALAQQTGERAYADRAHALVRALLPLACGAGIDGAGLIYLHRVAGIGQ